MPLFLNIQLMSTIKQAESTSGSAIFLWRNFHDLMPPFHDLSMRMSRAHLFICLRPSTCCQSSTQSFHKEEEFFLDFDDWEHLSFIDRNWRMAFSGDSGYSRQSGHPVEYGWSPPSAWSPCQVRCRGLLCYWVTLHDFTFCIIWTFH